MLLDGIISGSKKEHKMGNLKHFYRNNRRGTSLAVQWLRLRAPNAGGMGWIPGQGTKIPHATQHGQKKEEIIED